MNNSTNYAYHKNITWPQAWSDKWFRSTLIIGLILLTALLLFLPSFFAHIEKREGVVLSDLLLQYIPAKDFSVLIFIIIWSVFLLVIIRSIKDPSLFLMVIISLVILLIIRISTIYLFALNPPQGLIILRDPITSITYGGRGIFITKDLFFSGHTSNLLMVYLCLEKKRDKIFVLICTISVGVLVLVQHVHYTMDVIGAVLITFFVVSAVKKWVFIKYLQIIKVMVSRTMSQK